MLLGNVLVVDDEDGWLGIYRRSIEPLGYPIRFAQDLQEAVNIVKEMAFAVAIVDVRLDRHDELNVDGLRVFEEIVSFGDMTSLILVTGYGTMQIAREAFRKYNAFETVEKMHIDPEDIESLVTRAMEDFRNRSSQVRIDVPQLLYGERMHLDWWDEMLSTMKPKGGLLGMRLFLDELGCPFTPIIPESEGSGVTLVEDTEIAAGCYWSRARGLPILIAYGEAEKIDSMVGDLQKANELLGDKYVLGKQLHHSSKDNLSGLVWTVKDKKRRDFGEEDIIEHLLGLKDVKRHKEKQRYRKLRIFVATPSDVSEERECLARVIDELNRDLAEEKSIFLDLVRWETHARPSMGPAQAVINPLLNNIDVFVGIMASRFGTSTGVAGSGTEEEFNLAYESWSRSGRPQIMFYFKEEPIVPNSREVLEQISKVLDFKDLISKKGLYWTFKPTYEFGLAVRRHLVQILRKYDKEFPE